MGVRRGRGDASECWLSLGELEGDHELLPSIARDSRSINLVVLRASAVRASASEAVAVNSAILAVISAVLPALLRRCRNQHLLPTLLRRCRTAAAANGPERSPDSVMAKNYRHWRPFGAQ